MALQHSNAPTAKLGSPVTQAAPPQAIAPAHRSGYLITGGGAVYNYALNSSN